MKGQAGQGVPPRLAASSRPSSLQRARPLDTATPAAAHDRREEARPASRARPASARPPRPASAASVAASQQRPASALGAGSARQGLPSGTGRVRPASALASNRVPRHMEALRAAAPVSAIEEAQREVKHEQKYYDFVDPSDLPTPKWIPALTDTNFASRSRRGGSMIIPRKDITDVEMTLAVSSGGAHGLNPSRSRSRSSSLGIERAPSLEAGRDAAGVRGLWAPAAQDLLQAVFEAKCVDLKLKPLKERRERFFHKVRSQSTHESVCLCDSGLGPLGGASVAAMLKMHRCGYLDLCGNQIRDQGASAIAEMLAHNRSLTRLDLKSNDIGIDGVGAIFDALDVNSTLTELDLGVPSVGGGVRNRLGITAAEKLSSMG